MKDQDALDTDWIMFGAGYQAARQELAHNELEIYLAGYRSGHQAGLAEGQQP